MMVMANVKVAAVVAVCIFMLSAAGLVSGEGLNSPATASGATASVPQSRSVDRATVASAEEIVARLRRRADAGFGDGVALLTQTYANDPPDARNWSVTLFGRKGNAWLSNRYLVGTRAYGNGRSRAIATDVPDGWPRPEWEAMGPVLAKATPSEYEMSTGADGWGGTFSASSGLPEITHNFTGRAAPSLAAARMRGTLPGMFWPLLAQLEESAGGRVEVIQDQAHPGLVGLKVTQGRFPLASSASRPRESKAKLEVTILWIDPERDDMPVEERAQTTDGTGQPEVGGNEFEARYLQHERLPDGRWYPSRWQWKAGVTRPGGRQPWREVRDYELTIYPGVALGAEWFTSPADRLRKR